MSVSTVYTRGISGLDAPLIEVEVHLSQGLPALTIVGLAETAVRESKDRVRSAIINSGFQFPTKRMTINLAPANLPKEGTRLDLPIAIGILLASKQIPAFDTKAYEFIGELSLDGRLRQVSHTLTIGLACEAAQHTLLLPEENSQDVLPLSQLNVYGVNHLSQIYDHFTGKHTLQKQQQHRIQPKPSQPQLDLADIKGQLHAKRALEIAAAGGHSVLFRGPPGTGKTLLSSRLPSILPPICRDESLEVANIYSIANQPYILGTRPFRAPHHTASAVALVGGGSQPKPGEVSLAHHGVLFLDELPEFQRKVLEVLRQPLESQHITISRAAQQQTFPAQFQLIAAMNPCPCGYAFNQDTRCTCSAETIRRYQSKISGPLLDRIDLHVEVPPLTAHELQDQHIPETSAQVQSRVILAHQLQLKRQQKTNQALSTQALERHAQLDNACKHIFTLAQQRLNLSARGYHRILKVARTIADLDQSKDIHVQHLTEALSFRSPFDH